MPICPNDILPQLIGIDDGSGEKILDGSAWRFGDVTAKETDSGWDERELAMGDARIQRRFTRREWTLRGRGPIPHVFHSIDIGVDAWTCRFPDPSSGGAEIVVDTLPAIVLDTSDRLSGIQSWTLRLIEKDGVAFGVTPPEPEPGCILEDQFLAPDGTSVQDHSPETGGPWLTESGLGPEWPKIASERAYAEAGQLLAAASVSSAETDYVVRGRLVPGPTIAIARLAGRWDGTLAGSSEAVALLSISGTLYGYLEPAGAQIPVGSFTFAAGESVDVEMILMGGTLSVTITHASDPQKTMSGSTATGGAAGGRGGFILQSALENPGFELDEISICPE